ncbi:MULTISPECIES: 30S ribosomal protein S1 [Clostridium]|uniref:30S ribosomal protein S1 n=2 Tax=Clostridium TaxID=1485 RepID=A0A151AN97_9CLOT|nr:MULTISPECIES: 30S ribosomal protein S1 [Clostridium]KYH29101.1 30S ribosomal protein S1 [Clostridium colicanis DSM 13634]MBE6043788.1 30S ribosomal protein S1 [Clostridium thermopalmarium]PRR72433.1 30S ribosomal protein S1 [Clostridium thermopalmarium DSM 5974]PVZ20863.1 small subunit ribosomal protein S1 [Clostridium thermopalmarium DSM 5974]
MSSENLEEMSMKDMMSEIEYSMKPIYSGDVLKGEVISVSDSEVLVNIGYISDGIIKKDELSNEDINPKDILKPGDKIDVYVVKVRDEDGNVVLSKKKADELKVWQSLEESYKTGNTIEAKVSEVVKGGLVAYVNEVRCFIPASHASNSFVKDLNQFVGKNLVVKVIEFDEKKRRVVLSRKEVERKEAEEKKETLWNSLKKGEKRTGIVSRLAKFGAFVNLGGVDGLIHNSDLSWKRVNHPSEVVKEGDKVEVYVIDFDKEKGRISLGLKDVEGDPWNNAAFKYKVNDILEGTVVRLLDFGAFVEIEPGIEGLVHVTEITDENIAKPSQVLKIGDKVKVKILEINPEEKKMALSIKEAENKTAEEIEKYNDKDEGNYIFADLLKDIKF